MTKQQRKRAEESAPAKSDARGDDREKRQDEHHLRDQFAKDFSDAERDSCTVVRHRDERESDS